MANASGASGINTSDIISTFNVDKPEVRNVLYRALSSQGANLFPIFKSIGMDIAVAQDIQQQYEEDYIHQTIHVGSGGIVTDDAPTGRYHFVLDVTNGSNDFLAGSTTSPYSATPIYYNPVEQYRTLYFPNGTNPIQFSVTSLSGVGTNTVTVNIKQLDLTQTFTTSNYPQSTEIMVGPFAFPEGTDQPNGQVNKPIVEYNYVQIIKSGSIATGTQMTNQAWFTEYSDGSGNIIGYYIVGQKNAEYELGMSIDLALLTQVHTTNSIMDGTANEPVKTTEGHIPYARRRGNTMPYTAGSFSVGMFDTIDAYADSQFAPEYYFSGMGIGIDNEKDNTLKSYFQFTDVNYVTQEAEADLFNGDKGASAVVNFRYLKKGQRKYCFTRMGQFSNPKTLGMTGQTFKNLALFAPLWTKPDSKLPSNKIPFFGMIHKELGGYNRMSEIWSVSGSGPGLKVLSTDVHKLNLRSHCGSSHCSGNTFLLLDPQ